MGGIAPPPDLALAPIAPPPGAAQRLALLSDEFTLGPDGAVHLANQATKKLLNDMLCLPARMSAVLSVELFPLVDCNSAPAAAHPAAQRTSLTIDYSLQDLDGSLALESLRSRLGLGDLAPPEGPGTAPASLELQYLYWRRRGGGAAGTDPVYSLRLSFGGPQGWREPSSPVSTAPMSSPVSLAPTEPDADDTDALGTAEGPEEAAAEFLGALAPAAGAPAAAQAQERHHSAEGREQYSLHSRSRSPSRDCDRLQRSRSRSRSRSHDRLRQSYSQSPRPGRRSPSCGAAGHIRDSRSPPHHGAVPCAPAAVHAPNPHPKPAAWAASTACEDPGVVRCLRLPAPGTRTVFVQRIGNILHLDSVFINPSSKMFSAAMGLPRKGIPHPVRTVLVVHGSGGRPQVMLPTCFLAGGKLLRWRELLGAMGAVKRGTFVVFTLLGTLRMDDPGFKDPVIPFFAVDNRKTNPRA